MIGQVVYVGLAAFLQVNDEGTLESLPRMKWWAELWLYIKTRRAGLTIGEVRAYARKHAKWDLP